MFRDPTQRLLSSAGMRKNCPDRYNAYNCTRFKVKTESGCYVRFLNGEHCSTIEKRASPPKCMGKQLDYCTNKVGEGRIRTR